VLRGAQSRHRFGLLVRLEPPTFPLTARSLSRSGLPPPTLTHHHPRQTTRRPPRRSPPAGTPPPLPLPASPPPRPCQLRQHQPAPPPLRSPRCSHTPRRTRHVRAPRQPHIYTLPASQGWNWKGEQRDHPAPCALVCVCVRLPRWFARDRIRVDGGGGLGGGSSPLLLLRLRIGSHRLAGLYVRRLLPQRSD
jgi:hypothetical protein